VRNANLICPLIRQRKNTRLPANYSGQNNPFARNSGASH